jgi:hypothetical protein
VLDPNNAEVLTTVKPDPWWTGGFLLVPTTPLGTGNGYHLTYVESCSFGATAGEVKQAFDVGSSVTLPTSAGALHGTGRVVGPRNVPTSSGSCTSKIDAVAIDVRIAPTPELLSFAPITSFKVFIDGQEATDTYYGRGKVDADGIVVTTIVAACGTRAPSDSNGPTLGVHKIGVRAHVAGAATDPPEVVASFNFSCTDANVDVDGGVVVSDDAGTVTPDAGGPGVGGDAGRTVLADSIESSGEGCSASGASGRPAGAFAILVAGLTLVGARVRRKKR